MKFKDFQASVLFTSTFKAVNLGKKSTIKDVWEPCISHLGNGCITLILTGNCQLLSRNKLHLNTAQR